MPNPLLAQYRAAPGSYDELLDAAGAPRAHWRALLASLAAEAPDRMGQRADKVQRRVRENGVTSGAAPGLGAAADSGVDLGINPGVDPGINPGVDPGAGAAPWDLNALPLVLPHDEWRTIEQAIIERATLLNDVLNDAYGAQQLLAEGLLPPALVHGHPGFLRPCHGLRHLDGVALHFYAADLARGPDGAWRVLADRTQAPPGAGYALENRAIISPTFPDLLRELKVQPVTPFFRTMHDSLAHWGRLCAAGGDAPAPLREGEMPLTVLLTAGRHSESYYEQAYLARILGLALVEGGDLTVRDGVVYLKTLAGLHRVHVIVRRVDDAACDPLELHHSMLGVAGLLHAARRGNVIVANSLGAGLLESNALPAYLPALAQRLLGAPLKMASNGAWWCGAPGALDTVIANFDRLDIVPAFARQGPPRPGQHLDGAARAACIAALRDNPHQFVAQERVVLSQAPAWSGAGGAGLQARAVILRVFACATPDGYVVMPGGLTRMAGGADGHLLATPLGGASKDTWVQARAREQLPHPQTHSITSADLVRDDGNLSSRVAENLLWFGRHAERCDQIVRLLRVSLDYLFNVRFDQRGDEWPAIQALCMRSQLLGPDQLAAPDGDIEAALLLAVVAPTVPGLARQQRQLHRVAGQLHERFSVDNWRALNRMVQGAAFAGERPSQSEAMTILDDAAAALMMLSGFALDGMTRDLGWRFMSIGRRLERLQLQSIALQHALSMDANGNLDWLLELSDSIVTYRARYQARPEWLPVLDLLLRDETNPRSLLFQIDGILGALRKTALLHGADGVHLLMPLREALLALDPDLHFDGANATLASLLVRIEEASSALSEQISVQFFSYTGSGHPRRHPS